MTLPHPAQGVQRARTRTRGVAALTKTFRAVTLAGRRRGARTPGEACRCTIARWWDGGVAREARSARGLLQYDEQVLEQRDYLAAPRVGVVEPLERDVREQPRGDTHREVDRHHRRRGAGRGRLLRCCGTGRRRRRCRFSAEAVARARPYGGYRRAAPRACAGLETHRRARHLRQRAPPLDAPRHEEGRRGRREAKLGVGSSDREAEGCGDLGRAAAAQLWSRVFGGHLHAVEVRARDRWIDGGARCEPNSASDGCLRTRVCCPK